MSTKRAAGAAGAAGAAARLSADARLPGYLIAGFGALVAALATGQAPLAALATPFLALAALGLRGGEPGAARGTATLETTRAIEGDVVAGTIRLDWDGDAEVEVVLAGLHGVTAVEPAPVPGWALVERRGPVTLPFRLKARTWGVHDVATVWVRVRRPGGLLVREQKLARVPALWVLPTPVRLNRLLRPAEPRAVAGLHASRLRGHGSDFAELRPYRPGDRLRDLSWATSARLGSPWVTVYHSERTGTVLLLLEAVFGSDRGSAEALARMARVAWAVAHVHLRAQDRVGLLASGRATAWLPPRGGRRARWLLLEELLAVGGAAEDAERRSPAAARGRSAAAVPGRSPAGAGARPQSGMRVIVPADALVVGVTALRTEEYVRTLLHYRRSGHAAAALIVDTADLLPPPTSSRADAAARRLWLARRDDARRLLDRNGVPTAMVGAADAVGPAVSALRRRMTAR